MSKRTSKSRSWKKLPTNHLLAGKLMYIWVKNPLWDFFYPVKPFEEHIRGAQVSLATCSLAIPGNGTIAMVLEDAYHNLGSVGGKKKSRIFYKVLCGDKIGYIRASYLHHTKLAP